MPVGIGAKSASNFGKALSFAKEKGFILNLSLHILKGQIPLLIHIHQHR